MLYGNCNLNAMTFVHSFRKLFSSCSPKKYKFGKLSFTILFSIFTHIIEQSILQTTKSFEIIKINYFLCSLSSRYLVRICYATKTDCCPTSHQVILGPSIYVYVRNYSPATICINNVTTIKMHGISFSNGQANYNVKNSYCDIYIYIYIKGISHTFHFTAD